MIKKDISLMILSKRTEKLKIKDTKETKFWEIPWKTNKIIEKKLKMNSTPLKVNLKLKKPKSIKCLNKLKISEKKWKFAWEFKN